MGQADRSLFDMIADGRARLRARTLPALTSALVAQVRIAAAADRSDLRALSSAFGLVILLALALGAETAGAIVAAVVMGLRDLARTRVRFRAPPAPVITPEPINDAMLLDKRGRPLSGASRAKRLAALERERAERMALDAARLAKARGRVIELPPPPQPLIRMYANARRLADASLAAGRRAYAVIAAPLTAAASVVPVPSLSARSLRIVASTTAMTFVFAIAIGTTGIVAQQGRIALGASTTLSIIAGEVMAQEPGSSELRSVADGALLRAGMTIRTGASSYAILTYFEGSTVSLEPNTTIVIEQLVANPDGSTVIAMHQQLGRTWHSVTKLVGQGSKYEVRTPTLTATVRGTAFEVGVAQAASGELVSTVVTSEGAVGAVKPATPADPAPAEVVVPAGFRTQAAGTSPIAPPEPAPEPERKVTVTVGTTSAVVVDPLGRANGERDGKLVLQTPGATVTKVGGQLIVTLPDVPDGRIATVVTATSSTPAAVGVATVVAERGRAEVRSEEAVQPRGTAPAVTGVMVSRTDPAQAAEVRPLASQEKEAAPAPKVVDPPKPKPRTELVPSAEKKDEPQGGQGASDASAPRVSAVVDVFVRSTLPPLSLEEATRRAEEQQRAEERAKEEAAKREEQRLRELEQRAAELRQAEERAREEAARLEAERRKAEEQARVAPAAPTSNFVDSIVRAVAVLPGGERSTQDLRRAEERAKDDAARLGDERRKAEEAKRSEDIRLAEAARNAAEQRAAELARAAERARTDAAKELELVRAIEAKAREQTSALDAAKRAQAEKLLEEFRRAEEKEREDAARRLEEQRRAEESAKLEAERRLEALRRAEEVARAEAARAAEERRLEEQRRAEEKALQERRETRFVPPTIDPFPGALGSRTGSTRP